MIENFKAFHLCTPAVLGAATTTTSTTTTSTLPPPAGDTFDGLSLGPSWTVYNAGLVSVDVSGGALRLVPTASGSPDTWFNDGEGPLVYKSVTGNFDVRVVLATEDPTSSPDPPPAQYRLARILARDPGSGPGSQNYVHVALGSGAAAQGSCYEYKSTASSVSTWATTPTPVGGAVGELRLNRTGSMFEMFWRPDTVSPWTSIYTVDRPGLPATLHVAMMVYSTEAPPLIRASFDEIAFE